MVSGKFSCDILMPYTQHKKHTKIKEKKPSGRFDHERLRKLQQVQFIDALHQN